MSKSTPEQLKMAHPHIKFNESPRLSDGERAMFVRILSKADAKKAVDMLRELNPQAPAYLDKQGGMLSIYAPDGDLVFSMIPTDSRKEHFICRLNKMVFSQG